MPDPNDPPIIITGGSVNLQYDPATLPGSGGRHSNAGKKIRQTSHDLQDSGIHFAVSYVHF